MHIPDGYLSPSTCAVLYGVAMPFWYVAFARVKRLLNTRLVPLLAVVSAFCFVIMMFNVPLPGGTTGHAVGVGAATVVLGPWASMLSVSIALLIQAIFFGDGGITTLGANCFNMAIVGSLVAHFTYRAVAGRTTITSSRRVLAAATPLSRPRRRPCRTAFMQPNPHRPRPTWLPVAAPPSQVAMGRPKAARCRRGAGPCCGFCCGRCDGLPRAGPLQILVRTAQLCP